MGGSTGTVLVSSVQAGQTTILHTLGLVKEVISKFSKNRMKVYIYFIRSFRLMQFEGIKLIKELVPFSPLQ